MGVVIIRPDIYRLDELTPNALPRMRTSVKRKSDYDTSVPRKSSRPELNSANRLVSSGKQANGQTEGPQ